MRTHRRSGSWSCALLLTFAALPSGADTFWATNGSRIAAIAVDFHTGASHLAMQSLYDPNIPVWITAATTDPLTGILWVVYYEIGQNRYALGRVPVGSSRPQEDFVFPPSASTPYEFAAFSPSGLLYLKLWDGFLNRPSLVTLDRATGLISPVIDFAPGEELHGLAFNPVDGKLYITGREICSTVCVSFIDTLTIPLHQRSRIWESTVYDIGQPLFNADGEMLIADGNFNRAQDNILLGVGGRVSYPSPLGTQYFTQYAAAPAAGTEGCVPSFTRACLQKRRFAVDVTYDASIFGGSSGPATPLMESDESLKFSFFTPENLELLLKIIDGCSYNGHYWVFFSGLTNVGVSLRITDMLNGAVYSYDNPPGTTLVPALDIQALACGY